MFAFPSKFLLGAAFAATTLLDLALAGGCTVDAPFAPTYAIGDTNPSVDKGMVQFCDTLWDTGVPVTGLDVWASGGEGGGINAIQLTYANGARSSVFGNPGSEPSQSFDWDYSKTFIDSFSLWGNGGGYKLGNIRMVLKDGRVFDVGNRQDTHNKKTEYPIDVGAGVMLGFAGWGADNIRQGYGLFLKSQIDHITLTDPVFDESPENLNAHQTGIEMNVVDSYEHQNNLNATINWSFETTINQHSEVTTTNAVTETFGTSVSVNWEASILAFSVGGGVELSYEYSETNEKVETKSSDITRTITYEAPVKAGQHVYCRATAKSGKSDLGYTATVNMILKDGSSWSWREHGKYQQVAWADSSSECQYTPFTNARRSIEWRG